MTSNIDRAIEVIGAWIDDNLPHDEANFGADEGIAQALADAGRLRPPPSSRYDGYGTSFCRDEDAEDGPYIDATLSTHNPAPDWKTVHRAEVSIDIGGQHGYHNLRAYATAEWCREAAAILLDVADEVDLNNKEIAGE